MRYLLVLLLAGCATTKYVMGKAECEAACASYGYPILGVPDGDCVCDTSRCARPKHRGGCEPLPTRP